jgi:hypothetical protein
MPSEDRTPEQRLDDLGLTLPEPMPPFGEYVPAVRAGDQLWVGGHFGTGADGSILTGTVGAAVTATRPARRR